jgi:hypothetical protein
VQGSLPLCGHAPPNGERAATPYPIRFAHNSSTVAHTPGPLLHYRSMQQTFHATFARRAMFERRSSVSRCSFTSNKAFIAPRMSPLHVAITSSIAASFEKLSVTVRLIGMSSVELRSDMPFRADVCFSTLSTGQIGLGFHDVQYARWG